MMQKFKVGDKVRLLEDAGINYKGDVGYITFTDTDDCRVSQTNDPYELVNWTDYHNIELVEEKTMSDLKLEVGKAYKSFYGKKAVVLREDSYGFLVDYGDNHTVWHRHEDGGKSNIANSNPELSIVSEWVEEPKVTHKFKVGDRVVGNNSHDIEHRRGDTGIVDSILDNSDLWVTWDSNSTHRYCRPDEVTLIEEKPVVDIHNTQKKTWSEMTPEEKGALLLAHHEGKGIEISPYGDVWINCDPSGPKWFKNIAYRVKPSPVVETVELYSMRGDCFGVDVRHPNDKYKITYQTVDGEPDWSTIKGETL